MSKKIIVLSAALVLLICGACSGETVPSGQPAVPSVKPSVCTSRPADSPTPRIMEFFNDPYVPFYTRDLCEVIKSSDTIVLVSVVGTLPAERRDNYVYTPANIKVIQSLKGDHIPGDVFRIDQLGGVAGGIDFRPASTLFHENGETYLFFMVNAYGNVLHSEFVTDGQILKGYFFNDKTTDEAISIIDECIKTEKSSSAK